MKLPWHMRCDQAQAPLLFELADGPFQLVSQGVLAPVLSGYRYLLVERPLADFLIGLQVERLAYEQVVFISPLTGEEVRSHVRIRVGQFFTSREIQDLNLTGPRLLTLNDQYYFVSPELKEELETGPFPYLRFTEGLTGFGGGAA
jgi:hypothetical protein